MSDRIVLFVDDEVGVLNSLKRLLRREAYQVLTANDGAEALTVLATQPVHVIVSDQRMPEMNGVELLQQVKKLYPDVVRVMLSGYPETEMVLDALNKVEVYRFLLKPWNDKELKLIIRQSLLVYQQSQTKENGYENASRKFSQDFAGR